ncbi:MAG TPA: S41 family peptidase, partial [Gemmatimonadaceae bacterium]
LDAAQRAEAIDSLAAKLVRAYVFADVAQRIADSLRARRARGVYDGDVNEIAFATHLQTELMGLAHDKHLGVGYVPFVLPPGPSPTPPPGGPAPARGPAPRAAPAPAPGPMMPPGGPCAFERSKVLDDGVGYVKFNAFMHPDMCARAATEAMTKVANARALIIDLRDNHGGTPQMVAYVASYLVSERTHLNDAFERRTGETEQFWTRDDVPGPRFGGKKPIYVLTSSSTFSGAEEFAYDLQSLKRATIVGETTGGGAHMTATGRIGDHLLISVPVRRAINPITHTNWEGVGVQPDVKVPADQALETARRLIRERER